MKSALILLAATCLASVAPAAVPARPDGFLAFWSRFRSAALAGDMPALQRMTKIPLEVGFDSDQELERRVTASQFPIFMRTELRCPAMSGSTLDMLRADPRADKQYDIHNARRAVVGVFEFANGPAGWRLSTINYSGPESLQYRLKGRCD